MNARLPMYEGDGFIRQGLSTAINEEGANNGANLSSVPDFEELGSLHREARRLRSEHVGRVIHSIIAWIGDIPRRARQDSAERFIAGASDHADVERRIRALERNNVGAWNRQIAA